MSNMHTNTATETVATCIFEEEHTLLRIKLLLNIKCMQVLMLLDHLSRRLIGELIGYSRSGVRRRRPSVRPSSFTMLKHLLRNPRPIKAKLYVEPSLVGGTKVCSRHLGHMTKMAPTPIYDKKKLQKSSSPEPAGQFPRNLVCSIGDCCPS